MQTTIDKNKEETKAKGKKLETLRDALVRALSEKSIILKARIIRGCVHLHVDGLNGGQIDKLHAFKDEYKPSELNLKRSGTGITIIVKI